MSILPQLLVNALIAGSIYALASAGLSLTYGLLKILNLAHGHLMMLGAYLFYLAAAEHGASALASGGFTVITISLASIVFLRLFILPFVEQGFILTLVTTLALANIIEASVAMHFGVSVKSLSSGAATESYEIWGVYITPVQILIIVSAAVILSVLAVVLHHTSIGRMVRAISENSEAAETLGISRRTVAVGVFVLGSVLAAYAGVLVGYETNLQPTMGATYTIKALAAMILGGLGNLWGTMAGSFILGLVENLSIGLDFGEYSIPAGYKDAFAFVIILLILLVKPEGLFGRKRREA